MCWTTENNMKKYRLDSAFCGLKKLKTLESNRLKRI